RTPVQIESVVDRAFELMLAEPRGPVYLTLPREVLAARPGAMTITSPPRRQSRSERFPDPARIDEAARILARAEHAIILTSAAGDETALRQASAPTIGFAWASRCIGELVDESTVVVNEYPLDRRFAAFTRPGSYFGSPHSSGLGFGLGAALGVKLARPDATVIATVGDGAYFFGEPLSCLFVQRAHALPILTVIFK